jgi:branched-chain amino acid transport system ATP-binding protein
MTEHLLQVSALTKSFGGFTALDQVSFDIQSGERFGLIGPNGSGKTTLINCVSGFLLPNSGEVMFRSKRVTTVAAFRRAQMGISRTFQIARPFRSMTVAENLMVTAEFSGSKFVSAVRREGHVLAVLERMKLADVADTPATQLSQVQLRKMELARAIAAGPMLLISDEAMAGLTHSEIDDLLDCLQSLSDDGIAIIMIEHIMHAVMRFSQRVMCLSAGRIIALDVPEAVMADKRVQEAYLGT